MSGVSAGLGTYKQQPADDAENGPCSIISAPGIPSVDLSRVTWTSSRRVIACGRTGVVVKSGERLSPKRRLVIRINTDLFGFSIQLLSKP
jgi:hypothetical protein